MKRLNRAISEIESYRNALVTKAWHNIASAPVAIGLLNSAVAALMQAEMLTRPIMGTTTKQDKVDDMIRQVNEELRDEEAA